MMLYKRNYVACSFWGLAFLTHNNSLQAHVVECVSSLCFLLHSSFHGINTQAWNCWVVSEKAMAPHSSTLAWKIPWTEEPGRLQSMGLLRAGHDRATSLSLFTFMRWRRKWQPTRVLAWSGVPLPFGTI